MFDNEIKLVSIDCFDTLFLRETEQPEDIFKIIETTHRINNFAQIRILAQEQAFRTLKKKKKSEISLEDIYDTPFLRTSYKKIEEDTEFLYLSPNPLIVDFYKWAKFNNFKTAITSDMYLSLDWFKRLFKLHSLPEPDYWMISSDKNATKRDRGELFLNLSDVSGINTHEIFHLGDSYHSDVLMSRLHGVKSVQYFTPWLDENGVHPLEVFVQKVLAPLVDSFTAWLGEENRAEPSDMILFAARDCNVFHNRFAQQFDEVSPDCIVFFPTSRVSAYFSDWENLLENRFSSFLFKGSEHQKIKDIVGKSGLDFSDLHESSLVFSFFDKRLNELTLEQTNVLISALKPLVSLAIHRNRVGLYRYCTEIGIMPNMRIKLVDIGWTGSSLVPLANFLKKEFNAEISLRFMILTESVNKFEYDVRSMLNDLHVDPKNDFYYAYRNILEGTLSSNDNTLLGYDIDSVGFLKYSSKILSPITFYIRERILNAVLECEFNPKYHFRFRRLRGIERVSEIFIGLSQTDLNPDDWDYKV